LGTKIYAIRSPAPSSSLDKLSELRTVGIIFNWNKTVGFNLAGDNSRAFVFREGVRGTYGSLEKAYAVAQSFMQEPSQREGEPKDDDPVLSRKKKPSFFNNMAITSKFVLASIVLSCFLMATHYLLLVVQEKSGCTISSTYALYNGGNLWCQELVRFQMHIQNNTNEYMKLFFTQLIASLGLFLKYIIDVMFM
jgi:hypothetical protein